MSDALFNPASSADLLLFAFGWSGSSVPASSSESAFGATLRGVRLAIVAERRRATGIIMIGSPRGGIGRGSSA